MVDPIRSRLSRWKQVIGLTIAGMLMLPACERVPLESSPCPCLPDWRCCDNQCVAATDCATTRHTDSGADEGHPGGAQSADAGISVVKVVKEVELNDCKGVPLTLRVFNRTTVEQSPDWVAVSGCTPGTSPPRILTYLEQTHAEVARELTVEGDICPASWWSTDVANVVFDLDVSGVDSSASLQGLPTGVQVLPGEFATWYRGELRATTTALVFRSDSLDEPLGSLHLHTSHWTIHLSKIKQPTCPPLPPPPD